MKNMTIHQIADTCQGQIHFMNDDLKNQTAQGVVIDSRQVREGYIFVAIKGERVDGHRFIQEVFAKGALAVICEDVPDYAAGPCIQVKDCFMALKQAAAFYRQQLDIKVIGITGSVGKTSTKEFVASVLEQHYSVLKTDGNYNNEVGLPLTIFRIRDTHEIAVLEMGINTFGEMHRLSEVAKPDYCVMTNIGECHLEYLIDRDGVLRAKSEIFDYMNPNGQVFINGDDDKLITLEQIHGHAPVSFGIHHPCDIWADQIENLGLFGSKAVLHIQDKLIHAEISLPGEHMINNALAAAAVGNELGLSVSQIEAGIRNVQPVAGRSHLIRAGRQVIIDDCYNANPVSMKAAIDLLKTAETRKVAILGDMFELGDDEKSLHYETGLYAAKQNLDLIICVGDLSKSMYEGAKAANGNAIYFNSRQDLEKELFALLENEDTILIKASHGMSFDIIVDQLQKQEQ